MASTKNPFPGMNPYLEQFWPDVHTQLIAEIRNALGGQLPPGLVARSEEAVAIDEVENGKPRGLRADIAVVETWRFGKPPQWKPEEHTGPGGIVAAEPEILRLEEAPARWVEIRSPAGKVITIIEVISPGNRFARGRDRYILKQTLTLETNVNLVEIDLLRVGESVHKLPENRRAPKPGTHYSICAYRDCGYQTELYRWPLRERIPAVSIPLRPEDRDAILNLQPLIDRCYELGGYWQSDYHADPLPPLPADELAWLDERLRAAGLRP